MRQPKDFSLHKSQASGSWVRVPLVSTQPFESSDMGKPNPMIVCPTTTHPGQRMLKQLTALVMPAIPTGLETSSLSDPSKRITLSIIYTTKGVYIALGLFSPSYLVLDTPSLRVITF
jgi:hypothetical protein